MHVRQAVEIVAHVIKGDDVRFCSLYMNVPEVATAVCVLIGHVAQSLTADPDWGKAALGEEDSPLRQLAELLKNNQYESLDKLAIAKLNSKSPEARQPVSPEQLMSPGLPPNIPGVTDDYILILEAMGRHFSSK